MSDAVTRPSVAPKRLVAELAVIVLGILLALSADAWVSERIAAEEEGEYLAALQQELSSVRVDAEAYVEYLSAQIKLLAKFTDPEVLRRASRDSIGHWMASGLYDATEFVTQEVVVDELESSGRIALLGDEEIRRGLTRYAQLMERLRDVEDLTRDTQLGYVDPFLMQYGDLGLISQAWGVVDAVPDPKWNPQALIEAQGLLNLANKKIGDLDAAGTRVKELIAHLDSLLEALEG